MLRVTADTNVVISGLNFSGNPRRILQMAEGSFATLLAGPVPTRNAHPKNKFQKRLSALRAK